MGRSNPATRQMLCREQTAGFQHVLRASGGVFSRNRGFCLPDSGLIYDDFGFVKTSSGGTSKIKQIGRGTLASYALCLFDHGCKKCHFLTLWQKCVLARALRIHIDEHAKTFLVSRGANEDAQTRSIGEFGPNTALPRNSYRLPMPMSHTNAAASFSSSQARFSCRPLQVVHMTDKCLAHDSYIAAMHSLPDRQAINHAYTTTRSLWGAHRESQDIIRAFIYMTKKRFTDCAQPGWGRFTGASQFFCFLALARNKEVWLVQFMWLPRNERA